MGKHRSKRKICSFFQRRNCHFGAQCQNQHVFQECAYYDGQDPRSCAKREKCSFAHLDHRDLEMAKRLRILMKPDYRKFKLCSTPGCSKRCLGNECAECYTRRHEEQQEEEEEPPQQEMEDGECTEQE